MSDPRNGNGNGVNPLGGGMGGGDLGSAPLPTPGGNTDSIDVPGVGSVNRGETPLHSMHNYNRAVYDKLKTADLIIGHMREEMDKLAIMGDTVSPEDVIAGAGRLVGHGVPARELAQILSDMPAQAGQGLAAWISQQDTMLVQQEAHVAQMKEIAQHRMGVSAIRVMAANDVRNANRQQMADAGALGQRSAPAGLTASAQPQQSGVPEPQMLQMVGQGAQGQNGGGSS